jgi:hypothetical protein
VYDWEGTDVKACAMTAVQRPKGMFKRTLHRL